MTPDLEIIKEKFGNTAIRGFLSRLAAKAYKFVCPLKAEIAESAEPVPYSERLTLEYRPIRKGGIWGKLYSAAWFRFRAELPEDASGDLVAIISIGAEGCAYSDSGEPVVGITTVLGFADTAQPLWGKQVIPLDGFISNENKVEIYLDAGYNGNLTRLLPSTMLLKAHAALRRRDVLDLYYDVLCLLQYSRAVGAEKKRVGKLIARAERAAGGLSAKEVAQAREILASAFGESGSGEKLFAVGHAHLDLAWLWPLRETKRKAVRTYSTQLANIEAYPGYIFGTSQPQQLEWIKDSQPALFEKIKKYIAEGRIEPQGCMWVEPDTNLPCGESLIRQCYYGKKFWKENFGKDINHLWVPDVFGYSGALPQILKKCGADYFLTIKLSWNIVNKFPHNTFVWKGIDGSEILTHMPPEGTYNSSCSPYSVKATSELHRERTSAKSAMLVFGNGDGGAGPGEYHCEMLARENKLPALPPVQPSTAEEFFRQLEKRRANLPVFGGELYLEKHRGTYTTQAKTKKNNRLAERLLHNAEWLSTLAASGAGKTYPAQKLEEIWKEVLLYQFHDVLPGSSINRVYAESDERYKEIFKETERLSEEALAALGAAGEGYLLNPSPFPREGYITLDNKAFSYRAAPYSSAKPLPAEINNLLFVGDSIENSKLKILFSKDGTIASVVGKSDGFEYSGGGLNVLTIYTDKKLFPYNAWDIDPEYEKRRSRRPKLERAETSIKGAAIERVCIYSYGKSTITQTFILAADSDRIDFRTTVDWHETHKMLRADFYPACYSDKVLCDIQFGAIERTTTEKNSVEKAQFEICAHKWVDVFDGTHGAAVLNDCKYGYRVKNGKISLNLLRSTVYPDKTADRGINEFTYAFYPHGKSAQESNLLAHGYELNNPLIPCGDLIPSSASASGGAVVETIMTTPEGYPAIRIYEALGKDETVSVQTAFRGTPYETDMLFAGDMPCELDKLELKAFEVKTIVFKG